MTRSTLRRSALVGGVALAASFFTAVTPAYAKDTTPPPEVGDLHVYGKSLSTTKAGLTVYWTKPTVSDLKGVNVYRNTKRSLTGLTKIASYSTGSSAADASVSPGKTYWYFVRAYDKSGNYSKGQFIPVRTAANSTTTALSGAVTDSGVGALHGVNVTLQRGGNLSIDTSTDSNGYWRVVDLPYASRGFSACFNAVGNDQGGSSTTGYVDECYDNLPTRDPKGTRLLPVYSGQFRSIVTSLATGAALRGKVTAPGGTVGLKGVQITVYDSEGDYADSFYTTETDNHWVSYGLPAGNDYTVSVDPGGVSTAQYPTGLVAQWYGGALRYDYDPGNVAPSNVTTVDLKAGVRTDLPDLALKYGGAISGTVSSTGDASTSNGTVLVLGPDGRELSETAYDASGHYIVRGLPTDRKYYVCAQASDLDGSPGSCVVKGATTPGYQSVDWDGSKLDLPAEAKEQVSVAANTTTGNVDIVIHGINGTITGTVTGTSADVSVIKDDGELDVTFPGVEDGQGYEDLTHRGVYHVCAIPSGSTTGGKCWTSGGSVPWNGDVNSVPAGAGDVVVKGDQETPGIDFSFGT